MAETTSRRGRRLPVYLLLDCSGSMAGEPIEALKMGIRMLVMDLKNDPRAAELVWLSVIKFGGDVKQEAPLTGIHSFQEPVLEAAGETPLGEALRLLIKCIDMEVIPGSATQKADYRPMVFLMTDGQPTDNDWEQASQELRNHRLAPVVFLACAAGSQADETKLKKMTETVVRLRDTAPGTLGGFIQLVTLLTLKGSKEPGAPLCQNDIPSVPGVEMVP
jgi:uncharacterized protein YegL